MKTVSLKILNDLSDSFYYMGRLFIITRDRKFSFITHGQLFDKYLKRINVQENKLLKSILFDNKTVPPERDYLDNPSFKVFFDSFWNRISTAPLEIEIDSTDLTYLCEAPEKEPLDFVMYGRRAIVANRDGIFECCLDIEIGITKIVKSFTKIFDSKSIGINPRIGEILITTKKDGLFRASLADATRNIKVYEKPIESKSTRTGWAQFNFVNYLDVEDIKLFVNETTTDNTSNLAKILREDDGISSSIRVTSFAQKQIDIEKILPIELKNEIIFSFNSLQYWFFIVGSGKIFFSRIENNYTLSEPHQLEISLDTKELGRPLSAIPIMGGTVYEFFNKVLLIKDNREISISNIESKQMKTFGSSFRYQHIISILAENHLEIHSIFPYKL